MIVRLLPLASFTAIGCSQTMTPMAAAPETEARREQLRQITADCGLPANTLRLEGENDLQVKPPPDAFYHAVDCMLTRVRQLDYPLNMGFVGNEAPAPENR